MQGWAASGNGKRCREELGSDTPKTDENMQHALNQRFPQVGELSEEVHRPGASYSEAPRSVHSEQTNWAIHGVCACCGRAGKLGLTLLDEGTDGVIFWCYACIDAHFYCIDEVPSPDQEQEDDRCPDLRRLHSFKRLRSFGRQSAVRDKEDVALEKRQRQRQQSIEPTTNVFGQASAA